MQTIKVERAWIGAAPGWLVNPTLWLLALSGGFLAVGLAGYRSGALPAVAVVLINAVGIYLSFTVLHEATHGTAHENRRANAVLGRVAALPLTISFPLFHGVHHEHHSHTNDPERDPDLIVARAPRILLPLWCLVVLLEYRVKFFGHRLWRSRAALAEVIAVDLALLGIGTAAVSGGWFRALAVTWILPALVAEGILAFTFDFLPHYPYDTAARYFDSRICPGKVLNLVLLGQNYHLIHHLWTTIPWFRYRRVFAAIERALAERGCRIGWRVTPLPEGVPARAMPRG